MGSPVLRNNLLKSCITALGNLLSKRDSRAAYLALFGHDIERAARIMKLIINGVLDQVLVPYYYYANLCSLNDLARQRCLLVSLTSGAKSASENTDMIGLLCDSATDIVRFREAHGERGSDTGWLWKFCSHAGIESLEPSTVIRMFEWMRSLPREEFEAGDAWEAGRKLYVKFLDAKNSLGLKGIGATIFFYWLSLVNPRRFMPFDTSLCIFFEDSEECRKALEGSRPEAGDYYKLFLEAIHNIAGNLVTSKYRLKPGSVHDLIELYAFMRAQMMLDTTC